MKRFENKTAVVTGGAHGIGKAIADAFRAEGADVFIIDIMSGEWFTGDVGDQHTLECFAEYVAARSAHVNYLINNTPPLMKGIDDCSWEEFSRALSVGVTAPFYLTKLLMPYFAPGACVINISSSRDRMSQPRTESYTAAKGGIAAMTHAMAVSLAGKVRVNSISPGWIDTTGSVISGADALQQPVGRVGKPEDIAELALFLCSDKADFITGENICVDGGMTRLMIYHGEHGWEYQP
ncbi:MAG: SDR family oxidoreductase [Anaerolineaceae bacterium]|nr:SDR family oxidoreductase [Anaerolineaceae bacterium]